MILNLSKKAIISSNPLYRTGNVFGMGFLFRHCLDKNDSIVFQNCQTLCGLFLDNEIDILFINPDNSIYSINVLIKRVFLRVIGGGTIVLLPKGNAALTDTKVGDILDLNAELTTSQKKIFLEASELVGSVPGAVISKSQKSED